MLMVSAQVPSADLEARRQELEVDRLARIGGYTDLLDTLGGVDALLGRGSLAIGPSLDAAQGLLKELATDADRAEATAESRDARASRRAALDAGVSASHGDVFHARAELQEAIERARAARDLASAIPTPTRAPP
jgi:hypothetical protein